MSYQAKTDWKYEETVTENDLNRIEQGVKEAHEKSTQNEQGLAAHSAKKASLTKEGHVQLSNSTTSTSNTLAATPSAVKTAMDRADAAFTSASNGKEMVGNAITGVDDSVVIPTDPTFQQLADAIGQIDTGLKFASGTSEWIDNTVRFGENLDFIPTFVVCRIIGGFRTALINVQSGTRVRGTFVDPVIVGGNPFGFNEVISRSYAEAGANYNRTVDLVFSVTSFNNSSIITSVEGELIGGVAQAEWLAIGK